MISEIYISGFSFLNLSRCNNQVTCSIFNYFILDQEMQGDNKVPHIEVNIEFRWPGNGPDCPAGPDEGARWDLGKTKPQKV